MNECPVNAVPRGILSHSAPAKFLVKKLKGGDFASFYAEIRNVEIEISKDLNEEDPIPNDIYRNLGKAAMEMATVFTRNTLEIFQKSVEIQE